MTLTPELPWDGRRHREMADRLLAGTGRHGPSPNWRPRSADAIYLGSCPVFNEGKQIVGSVVRSLPAAWRAGCDLLHRAGLRAPRRHRRDQQLRPARVISRAGDGKAPEVEPQAGKGESCGGRQPQATGDIIAVRSHSGPDRPPTDVRACWSPRCSPPEGVPPGQGLSPAAAQGQRQGGRWSMSASHTELVGCARFARVVMTPAPSCPLQPLRRRIRRHPRAADSAGAVRARLRRGRC